MTPPDDLRLAVERVTTGVLAHALAQVKSSDVAITIATERLQSPDYFIRLEAGKELNRATSYRTTHAADAAAIQAILSELTKAQAALAEAREALEPFAKLAALMDSFAVSDGESPPKPLADEDDLSAALGDLFFEDGCGATVGDLRRARAVAKPGASDV